MRASSLWIIFLGGIFATLILVVFMSDQLLRLPVVSEMQELLQILEKKFPGIETFKIRLQQTSPPAPPEYSLLVTYTHFQPEPILRDHEMEKIAHFLAETLFSSDFQKSSSKNDSNSTPKDLKSKVEYLSIQNQEVQKKFKMLDLKKNHTKKQ
jgi:hypothetical protein